MQQKPHPYALSASFWLDRTLMWVLPAAACPGSASPCAPSPASSALLLLLLLVDSSAAMKPRMMTCRATACSIVAAAC